jgi:hypothetical protein
MRFAIKVALLTLLAVGRATVLGALFILMGG